MSDAEDDIEENGAKRIAFILAAISWGLLIAYRLVKAHPKWCRHLIDLPVGITELLLIMGGNFVFMAVLHIEGAFWPVVYILLSCCGVWLLHDMYIMYMISKLDIDQFGHIITTKEESTTDAEGGHRSSMLQRLSSLQSVVTFVYPHRYLVGRKFRRTMVNKFKGGGINEQIGGCPRMLEAEDIYADFDSDFTRILLLGLSQVSLLVMYAFGVLSREEPFFRTHTRTLKMYGFYYGGVFVQAAYIIGNNKLQVQYDNFAFWVNAFRGARLNAVYDDKVQPVDCNNSQQKLSKPGGRKRKYSTWQSKRKKHDEAEAEAEEEKTDGSVKIAELGFRLWARFVLSTLINSGGLYVIMILLPLQLSWVDNPTEFVLNAIAAFFIVELDDLGTPVVYNLITNDAMEENLEPGFSARHGSVSLHGRVLERTIDKMAPVLEVNSDTMPTRTADENDKEVDRESAKPKGIVFSSFYSTKDPFSGELNQNRNSAVSLAA